MHSEPCLNSINIENQSDRILALNNDSRYHHQTYKQTKDSYNQSIHNQSQPSPSQQQQANTNTNTNTNVLRTNSHLNIFESPIRPRINNMSYVTTTPTPTPTLITLDNTQGVNKSGLRSSGNSSSSLPSLKVINNAYISDSKDLHPMSPKSIINESNTSASLSIHHNNIHYTPKKEKNLYNNSK